MRGWAGWLIALWVSYALPGAAVAASKKTGGMTLSSALGMHMLTLENPDATSANYEGYAMSVRLNVPLYENPGFGADLTSAVRFLDLTNSANTDARSEYGRHMAFGFGLEVRLLKFVIGYEYLFQSGRHQYVGPIANSDEFNFMVGNLYYGLVIPVAGSVAIGLLRSDASASIATSETGLNRDTPYVDQAYWLMLKYSTGFSFRDLWRSFAQ